jgi:TonB family protein
VHLGDDKTAGVDLDMVARHQGKGIRLEGTIRRDGGKTMQAELQLVDGDTGDMPKLDTGGVVLQVRARTMAVGEPMPASNSGKAPSLAQLTSADEMGAPEYPKSAMAAGITGKVELLVYVDESGRVTDARVESAQPAGVFDEAALAAAAKWHFSEGARDTNGKRPQGWMRTPVEFTLDGPPKG